MIGNICFLLAVLGWCGLLVYLDVKTRKLPNSLTLGGAAAVLAFRFALGGTSAVVDGFAAACICGGILLIAFLAKGAGGGDVKMMFAAGALGGCASIVPLLLISSLAGTVVGVSLILLKKVDAARLKHYARCALDVTYDRKAGAAALPDPNSEKVRIPFSIAVAVGLLAILLFPMQ